MLSVLIVSWNTSDLTVQCIESLQDVLKNIDYEIIVVDNDSKDGSADRLQNLFGAHKRFHLLRNSFNAGFAAANNQAFEKAKGDLIALVNSDVFFKYDVLGPLSEYLSNHDECGLATCRLMGFDGKMQYLHRRFPAPSSLFFVRNAIGRKLDRFLFRSYFRNRFYYRDIPLTGIHVIDQAAGALMVIKRETIMRTECLFDEEFPIYGNDVDLCKRIYKIKKVIHLLNDHYVHHKGSASLGVMEKKNKRELRRKWIYTYYRKHENPVNRFLLGLLLPQY